jgi:hypothetical protein
MLLPQPAEVRGHIGMCTQENSRGSAAALRWWVKIEIVGVIGKHYLKERLCIFFLGSLPD